MNAPPNASRPRGPSLSDPTLARLCRPGPAVGRPAPRTIPGPAGGRFLRKDGRVLWSDEPRCERCGAPYDPGFDFARWCRGGCGRGRADRRLLVLSCSERKSRGTVPLPAWHVYDGNLFRICKGLLARGAWPPDVGVRILSAEHGLIRPDTPILPYDRRMTPDRAGQLRGWASLVSLAVFEEEAGEAYLALGATYRIAVDGLFPGHVRITDGAAGIGRMQAALKAWLGDRPPQLPDLFASAA